MSKWETLEFDINYGTLEQVRRDVEAAERRYKKPVIGKFKGEVVHYVDPMKKGKG